MTVNLSSNLIGLSILTGSNAFTSISEITFESKAVRAAKAQFTLKPTTPPWKEEQPETPLSVQVSNVKAMKTIIDKAGTGADALPEDVQTAFTVYKAVERLRVLAESASAKTTSSAQRAQLDKAFAKGLADLQTFLVSAPSDKVNIAFNQPNRGVNTVGIPAPMQYEVAGKGVVPARTDPVPGLTGNEVFEISLKRTTGTTASTVTVDLSQGPQPPTLDSVATAINAAIAAVPATNADGSVRLDKDGNPVPLWQARFAVEKDGDKWGMKLEAPTGVEVVTLDEIGAKDALVVASGQTALDAPTATSMFRIDDPAGASTRKTLATISALDRDATGQAALLGKVTTTTTVKTDIDGKTTTVKEKSNAVYADTDASSIVTDAHGNSYIVGTTSGDLGSNRSDGIDNLFLTKMDSEGKVLWQRSLGATGASSGAAVTLAPDGSIVVAGTVSGSFDGTSTDGDMVVAKFAENGDEKFATVVRSVGSDTAKAVAVGADGSIYVGGRAATGSGDGFVARLDASGRLADRRTLNLGGSDSVNGLAVDANGDVLALVSSNGNAEVRKLSGTMLATDLGSVSLGKADARAIAVAADGTIAVGGATSDVLSGAQVNAKSGARDGFVARIDAGMSGASVTYVGSSEDDQIDSLTFLGNDLYAGGRTTGEIGAPRKGAVDGFVTRIDTATGAIESTNQFGASLLRTEPVRVSAAAGGASALSALGFARGTINPPASEKLTTPTTLRPGDSFSIKVDDRTTRKIVIEAGDTLTTLADRIRSVLGSTGTVTTPRSGDNKSLRIDVKAGHEIDLIAGPEGSDALAKLGIDPQRLFAEETTIGNKPSVRPGGSFGLMLSTDLNLLTEDGAKVAMKKLEEAVSMSQTAYRSLYWDDGKASLVDGVKNKATGTQSTAREQAMLKNYQAALTRLSSTSSNTLIGF